jgi:prepilin-type processing-associated H-X9-DG protein
MTELNNQQKQLLFDYCLGLTTEEITADAEDLIASNKQAAEIHSKLKTALSPLKRLESDLCPDSLAEGTIWRLNNLARSSQLRLEQLLADEQIRGITDKSRFWKNLGEIVATAAVIVFVAGALIAPLNLARQKSRQQACLMQLQRIGQGINSYSSDHEGQLPAVATAMGDPWWKVGYQGKENYSNTRHIWLLMKGRYVEKPADFVCPGRSRCQTAQLDPSQIQNYNDFPSRKYVTYSFRIRCNKPGEESTGGRKVLAADSNPLFENLPDDYSKPLKLEPNIDLLILNSINHNHRGQNVLFCDGSTEFVKSRQIGASADDIFTLQDTDTYKGVEVPARETDAFLAP